MRGVRSRIELVLVYKAACQPLPATNPDDYISPRIGTRDLTEQETDIFRRLDD